MRRIELIYIAEDETQVREVIRKLAEAHPVNLLNDCPGHRVYESDAIEKNSAIIWVSDEATAQETWQNDVRGLGEDIRLIPVGSTQNVNYNDPNVIPISIEKLNFIRVNEECADKIWQSLITEENFYERRSLLLSEMGVWQASQGSEVTLRTSLKSIREDRKTVARRLADSSGSGESKELKQILSFLDESRKYAIKQLVFKGFRAARTTLIVAVAVGLGVFLARMVPMVKRLQLSAVQLVSTAGDQTPEVNAVKVLDGITNPLVTEPIKTSLYHKLTRYLGEEWNNSTIGYAYSWALNGAVMLPDEKTMVTADGRGHVIHWDAISGAVLTNEAVSENPLTAIGVSSDGTQMVCVDSEGYLFRRENENQWIKSADAYDIPAIEKTLIKYENDTVLVYGPDSLCVLLFPSSGASELLYQMKYDEIMAADLQDGSAIAYVIHDDELQEVRISAEGTSVVQKLPITPANYFQGDICGDTFACADTKGKIYLWSWKEQKLTEAPINIGRPIAVTFLQEDILAVHDRNRGTNLYELSQGLNLGEVLSAIPAINVLRAEGSTVYSFGNGRWHSQNLVNLLPQKEVEYVLQHAGTKENGEGVLHTAEITEDGEVRLELAFEGQVVEEYYFSENMKLNGKPCVIGIGFDEKTLIVGTEFGYLLEFTLDPAMSGTQTMQRQLPTRSPITAIHETEDGYQVIDSAGFCWNVASGRDTLTPNGMIKTVKKKITSGFTDDIKECVSEELLRELDVDMIPGHDGKEWE